MKELAVYVAGQLSPLEGIRYIPMMGGWLFYYKEKLFGGIYEDGFAVKDTPAARKYMPGASLQEEGWEKTPKSMLPCVILEDGEKLREMVQEMYPELPEPKKKAKKGKSSKAL